MSGLVVFDCDGVLIDSERLNVQVTVRSIQQLGWAVTTAEVIDRYVGRSEADQLADIAAHIGRPVPAEWIDQWREAIRTAYRCELAAVPGVVDALDGLAARGYAVCVASSATHAALDRNLGHCGLLRFFPTGAIFSSEDVAHGKPAPDIFVLAASRMGFAPEHCVVVEDSQHGIAAARAAGMPVVGYAGGVTPSSHLVAADLLLADLSELPAVVPQLVRSAPGPDAGRMQAAWRRSGRE